MLKPVLFAASLFALMSPPADAADSWGLDNETIIQMQVTVVDLACTLKNDCKPNCGDGKRQLGLLTAEGKLYPAVKSATPFAGLVRDLLPYCGQMTLVDGLIIANPALTMVAVQNIRLTGDAPWQPTTAFETEWTAKNGAAEEWMRADSDVKAVIAADGVYGIKSLVAKP